MVDLTNGLFARGYYEKCKYFSVQNVGVHNLQALEFHTPQNTHEHTMALKRHYRTAVPKGHQAVQKIIIRGDYLSTELKKKVKQAQEQTKTEQK